MYETLIREYENMVIYNMLLEHGFVMNKNNIKNMADEIINIRGLDHFINGVMVTEASLPTSFLALSIQPEQVSGAYDANNHVVYIHYQKNKDYINVLKVLLHELEHATQQQIGMSSGEEYDIKYQLLKLGTQINNFEGDYELKFDHEYAVDYYLNNLDNVLYDIHPYERFARIDVFNNLKEIVKNDLGARKKVIPEINARINKYLNAGYYEFEEYHLDPTHLFIYNCLNNGVITSDEAITLFDRISLVNASLTNDEKHYLGLRYNSKDKSSIIA